MNSKQRIHARDRAVQAAYLAIEHRDQIGYTQGGARWDGIRRRRNARLGQYPYACDCSSFNTWCLWNGMYLAYGLKDTVNGYSWGAGNTNSMLGHGRRVRGSAQLIRGDLVIYSGHVAMVVGRRGRTAMVASHGSNRGPLLVPWNYRGDVVSFRRYIL